jgi:hypothetical protein
MASADKPLQASGALSGRVTFQEATAINPPWTLVPAVALGEGGFHQYLLVERDGRPALRLELRGSHRAERWFRAEATSWNGHIAVGFAQRVYVVHPSGSAACCVELDACFDAFRPEGDRLLVVSGQDITCLDERGAILWRSEPLGIDGVVIQSVDNGLISGDGEWDPPGGWRPFVISLADGARSLARSATGQ